MAAAPRPSFKSVSPGAGMFLGLGSLGELVTKVGTTITRLISPAVKVTGTISLEGASVANQRDISLTIKDRRGNAILAVTMLEIYTFTTSAMVDFAATGGSTGIAAGAAGKLLTAVAKKMFVGLTNTSGVLSFIYTDTGTEAVHLGVRLPNGELVYIGNLTNA